MLLASCSSREDTKRDDTKVTENTQSIEFKVGQVWSYKTRPNEEGSTLTICRVEDDKEQGKILHVSIAGLKVKSPQNQGGVATEIAHMPFSYAAIESSITTKIADNVKVPNFDQAFEVWKKANNSGKPYVFTISVADAISFLEIGLSQASAP